MKACLTIIFVIMVIGFVIRNWDSSRAIIPNPRPTSPEIQYYYEKTEPEKVGTGSYTEWYKEWVKHVGDKEWLAANPEPRSLTVRKGKSKR